MTIYLKHIFSSFNFDSNLFDFISIEFICLFHKILLIFYINIAIEIINIFFYSFMKFSLNISTRLIPKIYVIFIFLLTKIVQSLKKRNMNIDHNSLHMHIHMQLLNVQFWEKKTQKLFMEMLKKIITKLLVIRSHSNVFFVE